MDTLHVPEGNLINISDDNREIVECIPMAKAEKIEVEERKEDVCFREFLCQVVGEQLTKKIPQHLTALGELSVSQVERWR